MRWTRLTLALLAAVAAGCASNGPSPVLAEGPRMIDLYRGKAAAGNASESKECPAPGKEAGCRWRLFAWPCKGPGPETEAAVGETAGEEAVSYARTAANELELLFPRLPNPDVYIYMLPHLATDERVPVPGYTTAVPLYERVEYALPGERAPAGAPGAQTPADDGEPASALGSEDAP